MDYKMVLDWLVTLNMSERNRILKVARSMNRACNISYLEAVCIIYENRAFPNRRPAYEIAR